MTDMLEAEASARRENDEELIAALNAPSDDGTLSAFELDVLGDPERGRWIALLGADAIGEMTYRFVAGRVVLLKVWVDHAYRNDRVATELIARVLDEIRTMGRKITIFCPAVGVFIERNPEYQDLIDDEYPGSAAFPQAAGDSTDTLSTLEADLRDA